MRKILPRIILDLIVAVTAFFGLWYLTLPVSLAGLWFFAGYVEIIMAGIVYDALFGMVPGMSWRSWVGTIVSVVIFLIVTGLKRVVRK